MGNSMSPLQTFEFAPGLSVSAMDINGSPWFVAADVCRALEIRNPRQAVSRLDDDEKGVGSSDTLGGRQQVTIINESGLYSLILRSRKESAKRFKKWVTAIVLPTIRTHGGYISGMEALPRDHQRETVKAIREEAQRVGVCMLEEREARAKALRMLRR